MLWKLKISLTSGSYNNKKLTLKIAQKAHEKHCKNNNLNYKKKT